jgi:diphthamide synthase (EF-2-diphthine--ammonia ligase)
MDQQFWVEYVHLFDSYKKLSIKNSGLNSALIEQIVSIAQNENVQFIYTGDLGHPEGIDVLLRQQSQLKIVTPGRTYVESYGKKAYVNHLISLGFVMPIISVRSDAVRIVEVGKILNSEYIEYLESHGIDCTGEDGEFQTIVTKASFFEKSLYIDSYVIESLTGRDTKGFGYTVLKPKKFYTENN